MVAVCVSATTFSAVAQDNAAAVVQAYLNENVEEMKLVQSDIEHWGITNDVVSKKQGIRNIHIAQSIDGIPVKNGVANFTLNSNDEVVYVGNRLVANLSEKVSGSSTPSLTPEQALTLAIEAAEMNGEAGAMEMTSEGHYTVERGSLAKEDITIKLNYWLVDNQVHLVWMVSLYQLDGKHWWQMMMNAHTGLEVDRIDWVVSCDFETETHQGCNHTASSLEAMAPAPTPPTGGGGPVYNVFAFPLESPNHGSRSLEVSPENSTASPFGWHDTNGSVGAEYTITRGNNVFAYDDVANNDLPGSSPEGTASLTFDFPYSSATAPIDYLPAAITNLFYANNMMHDVWYNYGFDEASGNFQANNYGNGGADDDYVLAEAQDGSGTNNANFGTPEDGFNPRMQMYLWNGSAIPNALTINSPVGISGTYISAGADFGPGLPATPITADVVLYDDGVSNYNDACEPATNTAALSGKIAFLYRGNCTFASKVLKAQDAGAVAVIIVNDVAGAPTNMGGSDPSITIPSIMISQDDGNTILLELITGPVNASIGSGGQASVFDSDLDNGIIAHEYGHGISNRLTGGPSNTGCLGNAEQMGEGWSDWFGLMLTIEPGDASTDGRGIGTYASGEPTSGTGIRPAPYSTDFGVNDFTYGDLSNTAQISQPHGVGFIFATALWDLNWALIDEYGGTPDPDLYNGTGGNNIAMNLVMMGLKMQPCNPGMIDGRDAILAADQLLYGGIHECLIWHAFANRGFGFSADQGSSTSRTDQTEAFDLPSICDVATVAPEAAFSSSADTTCVPTVSFTDESTDIPQSWFWDFGDGSTSTQVNPTHTYTANGSYTVELTVSNPIGSDSYTRTVVVDMPTAPVVDDVLVCSGDTAYLTGSTDANSRWRNAVNEVIYIGETLAVPNVISSQSFTVENVDAGPSQYVGPSDNTIGDGGYHGTGFHGALNFTADQPFEIVSAWVDADGAGPRTIELATGTNTDGATPGANLVSSVVVDLVDGPQRVDLYLTIPAAGDYHIGGHNVNLYRNSTGPTYPYTLPGYMTINSSSATSGPTDYYYYLYDIEVRDIPCTSPPTTATVGPIGAPTITGFTNLSHHGTTINWNSPVLPDGGKFIVRYHIFGDSPNYGYKVVPIETATSAYINGLNQNTRYVFRVGAKCVGQSTLYSDTMSVTTKVNCPKPTNPVEDISGNTVFLGWDDMGADLYKVKYREDGGVWDYRNTVINSVEINNLQPGTVYHWKVRAICNAGGNRPYISQQQFTTPQARLASASSNAPSVYPNPTSSDVNLQVEMEEEDQLRIRLMDVAGKVLIDRSVSANVGINTITIEMSAFSQGIYILNVENESGLNLITEKIIKQ